MIVTQDNQRLYPSSWEYNASRIMTELAKIVENNNGKVKPIHKAIISNRYDDNDATITVTHTSYISFVLDNMYYYYQIDSNMFFEFYFIKAPINNGKYSRDACMEEDKKEWMYDCFLKSGCPQECIVKAANMIFNMLCNAKPSVVYINSTRQKIPNIYGDGYHYETIKAKERFANIDF